MEMSKLFAMMAKHGSSDLHLKEGQPPVFRVAGQLSRMQNTPPLTDEQLHTLLVPLMSPRQKAELEAKGNVDFAHQEPEVGRFRCNLYMQRNALSAAIRRVNPRIPGYDELRLPPQTRKIAGFEMGLVLIGGVTGSGKSTTLACILDDINHQRRCHILTIEDPIEYLFADDKAIVNQRELGIDVMDFKDALKVAVRQNPDVMLVGEMRDAESFETALTAAETGHLVFGTIHTSGCAQTMGRILELFPPEKHAHIRNQLAFNLRCIMNQKLLKGRSKEIPRVPAMELMFITPIIKKFILDGEDHKIAEAIRQDQDYGCESYNQALQRLVKEGLITLDVALKAAPNAEELRMSMSGITISESGGIV